MKENGKTTRSLKLYIESKPSYSNNNALFDVKNNFSKSIESNNNELFEYNITWIGNFINIVLITASVFGGLQHNVMRQAFFLYCEVR